MPRSEARARTFVGGALVCALWLSTSSPIWAQTTACGDVQESKQKEIQVAQICQYNNSILEAAVDLTNDAGVENTEYPLKVDETLHQKWSLLVPQATVVGLHARGYTLLARFGLRTTIGLRPDGAPAKVDGLGGVTVRVYHALQSLGDLFRLDVDDRFIGAAPGTTFDVDLSDPLTVAFSVSDGRVFVTRLVSIHLNAENRDVDQIRVSEYIEAGGRASVRYGRSPELWRHFDSSSDGRSVFTRDLELAQASGDRLLAADAQWNLGRLGFAPPVKGGNGAGTAAVIGGAAALGGIILSGKGGGGSSTPATQSVTLPTTAPATPVPGSVTIQSAGRPTPAPTPTATPIAPQPQPKPPAAAVPPSPPASVVPANALPEPLKPRGR